MYSWLRLSLRDSHVGEGGEAAGNIGAQSYIGDLWDKGREMFPVSMATLGIAKKNK